MSREKHRAVREQLGAYALGQLHGAELAAVQAHLDGCPSCRAEVETIAPLAGPLRRIDPDRVAELPSPPPKLAEAVLARVRAEAGATPTDTVVTRPPAPPRRTYRAVAVAAAAVIAVLAGGIGFGLGSQTRTAPVPLEPVAVQAVADVRATANLVSHTWGVEIKLVGTGFTPGQVYRVTVTDDQGRTAGAGEFVGTGGEEMRCNLNSSVLRADAASFQVLDAEGDVALAADI